MNTIWSDARSFVHLLFPVRNAKHGESTDQETIRVVSNQRKRTTIKQRLFEGRVDAERNYRYYSVMSDRYRKYYGVLAFFIGGASFSPLLLEGVRIWELDVRIVLPALAGIAMLYLISFDIPGKAARAENVQRFYMILSHQWRDLWWNQTDENVLQDARMLEMREHAYITTGISTDDSLSDRCLETAMKIVLAEYVRDGGSDAEGRRA